MKVLGETDEQLARKFIGTWKLDEATVVTVLIKNDKWESAITTANNYYEHAAYKVTAVYEPGLLQLNADLDEGSLNERSVRNGALGLAANALRIPSLGIADAGYSLSRALARPDKRLTLILIAGEEANTLFGMKVTSSSPNDKEGEEPKLMLGAKQVHLTRQVGFAA